jgi:hypothetical protein
MLPVSARFCRFRIFDFGFRIPGGSGQGAGVGFEGREAIFDNRTSILVPRSSSVPLRAPGPSPRESEIRIPKSEMSLFGCQTPATARGQAPPSRGLEGAYAAFHTPCYRALFCRFSIPFRGFQSHKSLASIEKIFSGIPDMRKTVERFFAQESARSKTLVATPTGVTAFSESANPRAAGVRISRNDNSGRGLPIR